MLGHVTSPRRVHSTTTTTIMNPRKRMRLSSPTFDDQVGDLSQDDIDAFDSLDAQLSQPSVHPFRHPHPEDEENPFRVQSERIHASFTSASAIASSEPSDAEVDYTAWFNPDVSTPFIGFSTATTAMPAFKRPSLTGESAKSLFVPSAAALREAEDKMRKWQEDLDQVSPGFPSSTQVASPPQTTFSSARNAFSSVQPPETPTPASLFRSANAELTPSGSHSPLPSSRRQTKPFKSPLIGATPSMPSHRQLSTPSISSPLRDYHPPASQTTTVVSPLRPSSVANHVTTQKPLGFTPIHGTAITRPKFVTPFKAVAKSGISRPSTLENLKLPPTPSGPRSLLNRIYPPSVPSPPRPIKQNSDRRAFDLSEHKLQITPLLAT